jgi:hypothetical protein
MALAERMGQSSRENIEAQTAANRPNINTPFTRQSWSRGPDGEWTMNAGFAPGGIGTAATQLTGQVGQAFGTPLDNSLFGPVAGGDAARDQAINAAYGQAQSRLDPMWGQREEALRTRLLNQGLGANTEAFRNAMGELGRERTDAYQSALNSAIGQGTQAGQAIFQQNMAAHQQALADALRRRSAPLEELGRLQAVATNQPTFNTAGAADPTQYLQAGMALGNYNLQDAQQRNAVLGGLLGGLGSLGGGLASMFTIPSDEGLKDNIERSDTEVIPGVPLASWEWKGEPGETHVGVIAQDLERVAPDLVHEHPAGFKMVDYGGLIEALRRKPA